MPSPDHVTIERLQVQRTLYRHPHLVPVRVDADWNQFGELPLNMSVLFFPQDGSGVITVKNHNPRSAKTHLAVNTYDVVVLNELMDDLGDIQFRNMENFATAEAYLSNILTQQWMKKSAGEPVVADPDPDPDEPEDPGYDNPDDPIVFPQVKPEGTMDGGLTIDPGFDGDH